MHDDYEDGPSHDEILERHGWAEGEKEQFDREMAERQRRLDRAKILEARQQAAEHEAEGSRRREVPTARAEPAQPAQAASANAKEWRKFILATVRKSKEFVSEDRLAKVLETVARTVGRTVSDWDSEVCALTKAAREEALAPLRAEIAELRAEIAELRAASLRRTKPASDDEARQLAGEIRRAKQEVARLRAA